MNLDRPPQPPIRRQETPHLFQTLQITEEPGQNSLAYEELTEEAASQPIQDFTKFSEMKFVLKPSADFNAAYSALAALDYPSLMVAT